MNRAEPKPEAASVAMWCKHSWGGSGVEVSLLEWSTLKGESPVILDVHVPFLLESQESFSLGMLN